MEDIFKLLWELLVNIFETSLFFLFIQAKLQRKNKLHIFRKQILFLSVQTLLIFLLNITATSTIITIILSLVMNVCFAFAFYNGEYLRQFFWSFMYSVICLIAEYITMAVPTYFTSVSFVSLLAGGKLRIPFSLLYLSLIAVMVLFIVHMGNKDIFLSPPQRITFLLIAILGVSVAHYILIITIRSYEGINSSKLTDSLILVNLFFILMLLASLIYIYRLGQSNEQNLRLLELSQQHALEEKQYQSLLNSTEALREIKHDMQNHLNTINQLCSENDIEGLKGYVQSYLHSLENTHHLISTGNTAVDCILSAKLEQAKQAAIPFQYSVMLPEAFPINAVSLSSLLGNLIDNALEACERSKKEDSAFIPWISFYIKPFQGMVQIHIENNYCGTLRPDAKRMFLSSKEGIDHGIGLKRINTIVAEADGILTLQTDNNVFSVHIMLPLQKELIYEN